MPVEPALDELAEAPERLRRVDGNRRRLQHLRCVRLCLGEVARAAQYGHDRNWHADPCREILVGERRQRLERQPAKPRQVEVDVVARQPQLLEVRPRRLGRDAGVAQVGERGGAVPLGQLAAVLAQEQPVMHVLRRLAAERADQRRLQLCVRAVVRAADHVRDLEVEVVHCGRELIRRRAVRTQQGRLSEAERAVRVRLAEEVRGLAMADEAAALMDGPLVPADAEPVEVGDHRLRPALDVPGRIGVVDPEQQRPVALVREAAVGDGAQCVSEMERPGRARRETDADHGASLRILELGAGGCLAAAPCGERRADEDEREADAHPGGEPLSERGDA